MTEQSIEAAEISGPEPSAMSGPRIPRSFFISNDSAQSIEPFEISGPQISDPGYDRLRMSSLKFGRTRAVGSFTIPYRFTSMIGLIFIEFIESTT
ncbi:hypothetical protein RHGRI_000950 [Rhododendron griersonianum]|uniref:NADH-plastoquinone oxidoreductase subunit K n=1 Tax=Rhododendron griersonianum TaxID=479676 RepID=A0AAV6LJE2_9ERIC|nr:hypothetical protein RHGRI_000950 [Rhododendron griersonianum]